MKQIFIFTAFLFVAYSAVTMMVRPKVIFGVNQNQTNQIQLEQVVLGPRTCKVALFGSSILSRFENAYLPPEYCNLALGGDSAITGLEALKRAQIYPPKILIEVNALRDVNDSLLNQVFEQPWFQLKKILPAMRADHQPVTLLFTFIRSLKTQFQFNESYNEAVYQTQLQFQLKKRTGGVVSLKHYLDEVKALAEFFKEHGSEVKYIEIPMDPEIENDALSQNYQREIKESGIIFERINCPLVQTSDAIHLTPDSVKSCVSKLLEI